MSNENGCNNFERARNEFMYFQNQYGTYSLVEYKHVINIKNIKEDPIKKRKRMILSLFITSFIAYKSSTVIFDRNLLFLKDLHF